MYRKKTMCVGDSLALPGHQNTYEDTWFFKIKNSYPHVDFISFFKRQLTSEVLIREGGGVNGIDRWPKGADVLEAYLPDTVILQLGIVDCAPRLLYRTEQKIIQHLPKRLSKFYIDTLKVIRGRRPNNTIVSPIDFKRNFNNYINRCIALNVKKIFIILICNPDDNMTSKNPNIRENVKQYNDLLYQIQKMYDQLVVLIPSLDQANESGVIYEDGYHPNSFGNTILSNRIIKAIDESRVYL